MIVTLEPFWQAVVDYYWNHKNPDTDGSIWEWIERDYRARRTLRFPCSAQEFYSDRKFDLVFNNDADATFFILRWA